MYNAFFSLNDLVLNSFVWKCEICGHFSRTHYIALHIIDKLSQKIFIFLIVFKVWYKHVCNNWSKIKILYKIWINLQLYVLFLSIKSNSSKKGRKYRWITLAMSWWNNSFDFIFLFLGIIFYKCNFFSLAHHEKTEKHGLNEILSWVFCGKTLVESWILHKFFIAYLFIFYSLSFIWRKWNFILKILLHLTTYWQTTNFTENVIRLLRKCYI